MWTTKRFDKGCKIVQTNSLLGTIHIKQIECSLKELKYKGGFAVSTNETHFEPIQVRNKFVETHTGAQQNESSCLVYSYWYFHFCLFVGYRVSCLVFPIYVDYSFSINPICHVLWFQANVHRCFNWIVLIVSFCCICIQILNIFVCIWQLRIKYSYNNKYLELIYSSRYSPDVKLYSILSESRLRIDFHRFRLIE